MSAFKEAAEKAAKAGVIEKGNKKAKVKKLMKLAYLTVGLIILGIWKLIEIIILFF